MTVMILLVFVSPCTGLCETFSSDFHKTLQDYGLLHWEEPFTCWVDTTQTGQMAAILNLCYNILL